MGEVDRQDRKVPVTRLLTAPGPSVYRAPAINGGRLVRRGPGFSKVYEGEFSADAANSKAPRFPGESKGLLWLEEELGLQPA